MWIGVLEEAGATLAVAAKSVPCVDFNPPRLQEIRGLLRARQGLHHPNIARLIGVCLEPENDVLWAITEYAEFGDLSTFLGDVCQLRMVLSTESLLDWAGQIVSVRACCPVRVGGSSSFRSPQIAALCSTCTRTHPLTHRKY